MAIIYENQDMQKEYQKIFVEVSLFSGFVRYYKRRQGKKVEPMGCEYEIRLVGSCTKGVLL